MLKFILIVIIVGLALPVIAGDAPVPSLDPDSIAFFLSETFKFWIDVYRNLRLNLFQ